MPPPESIIGVRDLARRTSALLDEVSEGRAFLVTRNGRPIAMIVPVEESLLEDFILATAREYVDAQHEALSELAEGRTITLESFKETDDDL